MPYARKRYAYRGKARRSARTLSTRRIFSNKGARSQAKQIYALRKSINRVRNAVKPEVKVLESSIQTTEFTATTSGESPNIVNNMWRRYDISLPAAGPGDDQKIGNMIRPLAVNYFINAQYGRVTHSSSGIPMYNLIDQGTGGSFRIVAIQAKQAHQTKPTPTDIFPLFDNYPQWQATIANMTCPFRNGITTNWSILYDKVKYINENRPIYTKRLKFKSALKNIRWEEGFNYPRGTIYIFIIFAGLRSTTASSDALNNSDYEYVALNHHFSLPYTDA